MDSVIKGASYVLAFTPDMVINNGTNQTIERSINPKSEYLKQLESHLRTYEDAVKYPPNQTYIGNITPKELGKIQQPWYDKEVAGADRFGKFGEIMPEDEFICLMQICDSFDLVKLERSFTAETRIKLENHPALNSELLSKLKEGEYKETIHRLVNDEHSEPMYYDNVLVGCVKRAHDIDKNLEAGIMLENLAAKATNVLAILNLLNKCNIDKEDIEYVIDCCEEACGDMNQRGGGNFAKACAETAGLTNATGSDVRGFCAGPAHALIMAASLVKAGTFKNVIVSAGGSTAKLGLNGKGQVKKGMPVLEDTLGGFAILVSENDGINPEVRVDLVGRHTVGTGSSPQAVITSLVSESLDKVGMKITDIDRYSVEMQNPDITKSAGAGDVPLANYKMIGSLAVKRGDIEKNEIIEFAESHGMVGWAPTQGHIPSGVPYIGFARQQILNGEIMNAMIIGKGSLFIGRMTNIFDGMSVIMEANKGIQEVEGIISEDKIKELIAQAMKNFASSLLGE